MPGFCIILSSASGGLGGPQPEGSLRWLHFPTYSKKIPSIQNLNETTVTESVLIFFVPFEVTGPHQVFVYMLLTLKLLELFYKLVSCMRHLIHEI